MSQPYVSPLWHRAASLAGQLHRHQTRKDGITPFVVHPVRVAFAVAHVFGLDDPVVLAAALLHDTLEDTSGDYDDIAAAVGTAAADHVAALTKNKRLPEDQREAAYEEQLLAAPWEARLIKLADIYDNLCDAMASGVKVNVHSRIAMARRLTAGEPRLAAAAAVMEAFVQAAGDGLVRAQK